MSCLGSLLHKDPIRTQPGWQLAQISHMQCVKTFAWLKSSGRFIYFETCSLYPIWDYSSPAICEGVQLRSNQLFFGPNVIFSPEGWILAQVNCFFGGIHNSSW
jgi:hypothetical protein